MDTAGVRRFSQFVECLHAPVYFAPETQAEYAALGLRGFWRGYFAGRAAALGPADAATVTRLFGGFAPAMVARAIPSVWDVAAPGLVLDARARGAVAALYRLLGEHAALVPDASAALVAVADGAVLDGCELAAAHAALPRVDEPWTALWQAATVLRELRGDLHLAVLAEHALPWPEPHLLLAGLGRLDPRQRDHRGFTGDEWAAAEDRLRTRGLFGTDAGRELAGTIESRTDAAFARVVTVPDGVVEQLRPLALAASSELPFPNAMGLPRPT
ncbi:MAG: SCO6745 family protein [Jatrophihabitans sp.]|uniref:SCO6745 family protein n=1 Tax=Jatrophihabitans sp. TaxID=1932789 RepID=UPI003F817ECB